MDPKMIDTMIPVLGLSINRSINRLNIKTKSIVTSWAHILRAARSSSLLLLCAWANISLFTLKMSCV